MIDFLTKLIKWLDKIRLAIILHSRRAKCTCLCDLCTKDDCPAKVKVAELDIQA